MTDAHIGQKLGKYTITEKIGRGGMAMVYKAYQENLGRFVAVKIMHSFLIEMEGENFFHRFQREARAMAAISHPHIVRVYDFDTFGENNHYIVMDYVGGGALKERLEKLADDNRRMPLKQSIDIITKIADALAYAHKRNMIHRDIKPANILMGEDGEPYLTDFGIVKLIGGQTVGYTATGALIGTPSYMAPEQALGQPGDARSDIYSLGVMLFQMVTGVLPFDADTPLAVAMKHVRDQVPLPVTFNPSIPQSLQAVILKALAKDPAQRFQTASDMVTALRRVDLTADRAAALPPPTSPSSTIVLSPSEIYDTQPPQTQSMAKKWRWPLLAAALIALLLLACAGAYFVLGSRLGLPGFDNRTPVAAFTATPSSTPQPATAVPTITSPPTITPNTVATILAAANMTTTSQAPTAVADNTATPQPRETAVTPQTPTIEPTASPTATATATATETSNGTGTAHVGSGLPLNFETFGVWVRGDEDNGSFTQSAAHVHGGSSAAKLSYDFQSSSNDYIVFMQLNSLSGTPDTLQVWVYGDGSGHFLNAWIVDNNSETWQVPLGRITHTGWQQMSGRIATGQDWPWTHISGPSNDQVDYPITFRGFVLDDINNAYTGQGAIYLDDLTATTLGGAIPTAQPVTTAEPAATTSPPVDPGSIGRILYTSGSSLLTTDPDWSSPQEVGSFASNTCSSPAATVAGQSYNLYYGNYCGIGATGTGVCASPNGQYEVITNRVDNSHSIVVRTIGVEGWRFVYQGSLNISEGIRWSPLSDSFLFMIDNSVYRAFPDGSYNAVIPTANTPIFSPNGSLILYLKPVGPGIHDIFVSNADGSNQHNVTNALAVDKICAAWRN